MSLSIWALMVLQLLEYFDIELKIEKAVVLILMFSFPEVNMMASKMFETSDSLISWTTSSTSELSMSGLLRDLYTSLWVTKKEMALMHSSWDGP